MSVIEKIDRILNEKGFVYVRHAKKNKEMKVPNDPKVIKKYKDQGYEVVESKNSWAPGKWVVQKHPDFNIWMLLLHKMKNGGWSAITVSDDRMVAAKSSIKNAYPEPQLTKITEVPPKIETKVNKKLKQLKIADTWENVAAWGMSESLSEAKSWESAARSVVKNKQMVYINPKTNDFSEDKKKGYIVLDSMTANMLTTILDNLSGEVKKKFTNLNLMKAVDIGWKMVK